MRRAALIIKQDTQVYIVTFETPFILSIFAFSRNERTHPNLVSQAREIEICWTANWPPL